ncbi:hypothetical protein DL239_10295 [Sedimentitalea sp. CY04]|uniref:DnaA N-terminal domain-containing protein n=1 Tax=Parasedimentitalea denitrificans TaxID=2211118 RepID=A0ABX0W700_9RHOB|nr:hypothetical protein [Sedimentitalea sp. CY04]NIZ61364.1 hypothetical protein [Sedimentitalea sp. CY04]
MIFNVQFMETGYLINAHKTDWLQDKQLDQLQVLLTRYALRAFPAVSPKDIENTRDEDYFIRHARSLLVACCWVANPEYDLQQPALSAAFSAGDFTRNRTQTASSIACKAASKVFVLKDKDEAKRTVFNAIENLPHPNFFEQAQWDLDEIGAEVERLTIYRNPLWTTSPEHFNPDENLSRPKDIKMRNRFTFWQEWFQGFRDGKPLDWNLQLQVALIEDAIWDAGPEAVAKEIERIRAKFDLEQEVKQLKGQLLSMQQTTATPQIGDNGGPPLNDPEDIAFQTDLSQTWQQVEKLEDEIDSPTPSTDKLNALAAWFQAFFIRATKYLGAKADIIITKGCEAIGTTGTKALIAYFTVAAAAQNETVHSLPKAILDFIKSLAGG